MLLSNTVNEYAVGCTPSTTVYSKNLGRDLDSSEYTFDGAIFTFSEVGEFDLKFSFEENINDDFVVFVEIVDLIETVD